MFNGREYYGPANEQCAIDYAANLDRLLDIQRLTAAAKTGLDHYFSDLANRLLYLTDLELRLSDDYFAVSDLEELQAANRRLHCDQLPEGYPQSYADPAFAAAQLGSQLGPLLAYFHANYFSCIRDAFQHNRRSLLGYIQAACDLFDVARADPGNYALLKKTATRLDRELTTGPFMQWVREMFDPQHLFYQATVAAALPADLRYLYRYGKLISDHEFKLARHFWALPDTEIDQLAAVIVQGYIQGFKDDQKDLSAKRTLSISAAIGSERLVQAVIAGFTRHGLDARVADMATSAVNRQLAYDHRFDSVLYLDSDTVDLTLKSLRSAAEAHAGDLRVHSGTAVIRCFGAPPFSPEQKEACLQADPDVTELTTRLSMEQSILIDEFRPRNATSFTVIAFPSPQIRGDFEAIFRDTVEFNLLSSETYGTIQQTLIDTLDRAQSVVLKGSSPNRTDLRVAMPPLADPTGQTNFTNGLATLNIPLGEVFTTPRLKDTNGILHIEETFLNGLKFSDLVLEFKDGYVADYSCSNFPDSADGRRYIEENLLFPHKTLPIGEFAIGTNTHAYAMAKRHGIMDLLPVLIIEKMGPHLAIGDPCYAWTEDLPRYNQFNGKEITARANEKTRQREQDIQQAYTNIHTDITLPYSSLDSITAVLPGGSHVEVIKDGRFVLAGTESLNSAIDEVDCLKLGQANEE